ncbi:MAG: sugar phosphate isomerase/epimerase family protein [Bacteroidales bacterium]
MKKISKEILQMASYLKGRREFIRYAALGAAGLTIPAFSAETGQQGRKKTKARTREEKLKQISSNSYAVNQLFSRRATGQMQEREETRQLKEKYREITLLDFPQFTKDFYPGVNTMDLWSSLFGDFSDDSMFTRIERNNQVRPGEFDPSTPSGRQWLDKLVKNMVSTGVSAVHISNNAPRNLADLNEDLRKEGIRVGKIWLDAAKQIGAKSMRVNTGGPQIIPTSVIEGGYPRNKEIVPYLKNAIESFKELADYGGKTGIKVTIENHWGLAADPVNIIIILNEVNSPWCEASPDFCNWGHEYMLYNGLDILTPRATTMIHAKRWTRYPDVDIAKCVSILNKHGYKGWISLEYEAGGDPVEGTLKLMNDVVDALV